VTGRHEAPPPPLSVLDGMERDILRRSALTLADQWDAWIDGLSSGEPYDSEFPVEVAARAAFLLRELARYE
jgi:hypothetical protein